MADRITRKHLEGTVDRINRVMGTPAVPFVQQEGKLVGQVGNYHLDWAYGGATLHQMANTGGGVHDVLRCGFCTQRQLYELMHAFLRGIEAQQAKEQAEEAQQ